MIVDRHDPGNLSALAPQLQLELEPMLAELVGPLDDDDDFQRVKADLACGAPKSLTRGRHSTPVEVILRMLVVRRLYQRTCAETEQFVSDTLVLRQFCRFYLKRVPDDITLIRWAGLIESTSLEQTHAPVVTFARHLQMTRGQHLWTDRTVVETTNQHPTDNPLLADGVRVLSRLGKTAQSVLSGVANLGTALFRDRTGHAQRLARQIGEGLGRRGETATAARQAAYRRLVRMTAASLEQASRIVNLLGAAGDGATNQSADMTHCIPPVELVADLTCRRVFDGETVPAAEMLVSLFEPDAAIT